MRAMLQTLRFARAAALAALLASGAAAAQSVDLQRIALHGAQRGTVVELELRGRRSG